MRLVALLLTGCLGATGSLGAASLTITSPVPRQVIQRTGFVPADAWGQHEGGPALGSARVSIRSAITDRKPPTEGWQARAVPIGRAFGRGIGWTDVTATVSADQVEVGVDIPAGGWYRIELKSGPLAASVEPVGIGDIFLIAGQSYAANTGEEKFAIDDPEGRVVALDLRTNSWATANDPQPAGLGGNGGSLWPNAMNLLMPLARVPIGLVNVAVGGTAVGQWLPGEVLVVAGKSYTLHRDLVAGGAAVGRFRAVLWQQGESDVLAKTSAAVYQQRLNQVVSRAAAEWGFHPPWMLAKSTCHPTVYMRPAQEAVIRDALQQLTRQPDFLPGPDTDILCEVGVYRAPMGTRRHFSGPGQRAAGQMWFATLWNAFYSASK